MSDQTRYRPAGKYAGPSAQRDPVQSCSSRALAMTSRRNRESAIVKMEGSIQLTTFSLRPYTSSIAMMTTP
jgi:hypothetical protein